MERTVCMSCGTALRAHPLQRGRWYHVDGTAGLACADARGDRRIVAVVLECSHAERGPDGCVRCEDGRRLESEALESSRIGRIGG